MASDDCQIWHNYDGREKDFADMIPKLAAFGSALASFGYRERCYLPLPDGALALHILHGQTLTGIEANVPVAVRLIRNGERIDRIKEYVDPSALAPLLAG